MASLSLSNCQGSSASKSSVAAQSAAQKFLFTPVRVPHPQPWEKLDPAQQKAQYATYEVQDELVLPEGYTYDLIASWGDPVGDSHFGFNNDYVAYIPDSAERGFLVVNFEYIDGPMWLTTHETVTKKNLPIQSVLQTLDGGGAINVADLPDSNPLKGQLIAIAKAGLTDLGMGILGMRQTAEGVWERTFEGDRRITGISGLEDDRYLRSTGPAVTVFNKPDKLGYEDGLGARIIGTFQNCAGGTTPWGTVLSAEENFQSQVPEAVKADGSSFAPLHTPYIIGQRGLSGAANAFGLAGNKYGWMVEVDPSNPDDYGTKHTLLGRFRHEAVAVRAETGQPLTVYSGCDRRGGHLYKFVSQERIKDPTDKANSELFAEGILYGAQLEPDGIGRWLPLLPETAIDPVRPSTIVSELREDQQVVALPHPDRQQGGIFFATNDQQIELYRQQYQTLGDLYVGEGIAKQGAILIDAHFAASAVGVTCTARPEDTELAPDGSLYIAFTSGTGSREGGPDRRIFVGPQGETNYEFGWIMRLIEDSNDPAAQTFRWEMFALGGEQGSEGAGFSNPDNLAFDRKRNLWMVTDIGSGAQNRPVSVRLDAPGAPLENSRQLLGLFGNNSAWVIPTTGENAGVAVPFAIAPMESEICGPCFGPADKTLFMALQHPGEIRGPRQNARSATGIYSMQTTNGDVFMQNRRVPLGSNWPANRDKQVPRPSLVAVRRLDGQSIT
ncbi:MAG: alkaline phosphatase PhoX [Cyanobacteria bacterium P01_H01_bin.15]